MGHIIPEQFGGRFESFNLVAQSKSTNLKISELESDWLKHLKAGHNVNVHYELVYKSGNNTMRPDVIKIKWWLNNHEQKARSFVTDN